jgi:hypothetical protein
VDPARAGSDIDTRRSVIFWPLTRFWICATTFRRALGGALDALSSPQLACAPRPRARLHRVAASCVVLRTDRPARSPAWLVN